MILNLSLRGPFYQDFLQKSLERRRSPQVPGDSCEKPASSTPLCFHQNGTNPFLFPTLKKLATSLRHFISDFTWILQHICSGAHKRQWNKQWYEINTTIDAHKIHTLITIFEISSKLCSCWYVRIYENGTLSWHIFNGSCIFISTVA